MALWARFFCPSFPNLDLTARTFTNKQGAKSNIPWLKGDYARTAFRVPVSLFPVLLFQQVLECNHPCRRVKHCLYRYAFAATAIIE